MTIRTVGVIGLGAMGRPMSRHMVKAGYEVVGFDPVAEACSRSESESGIIALPSPKAVAERSDAVMIVVGFEKQVEQVLLGEDGILAGARPGLIVGVGSTVSPTFAQALAARVKGRGIKLVDMPLTRSAEAAEGGNMLVLGGGDPDAFEACRPLLETFAVKEDIFNLGPFGSGQVAKMVNNMILWACMAANDEGLRFGERFGIDQETMRAALVRSSAANFPLIEKADTRPIPWAEKDMVIAQQEADRLRFAIPLCGQVKEIIKAFKVARGYPTPTM
ncbi:MAG: NAD(P)-dependent oxidoreductase [Rhizobiales bacterium]|nr:NAD(P)-dependent oxidoreductase [Hyphomicrobiales bacterium]